RISFGSFTRARAMATRCCSPPDNSIGRCPARSARPTDASEARAATRAAEPDVPAYSAARATFSSAVSVGTRLKDWNTKPMDRAEADRERRGLCGEVEEDGAVRSAGLVDQDDDRSAQAEPDQAAQQPDDPGLGDELADDASPGAADGPPDADLAGPLGHAHGH